MALHIDAISIGYRISKCCIGFVKTVGTGMGGAMKSYVDCDVLISETVKDMD